MPQPLKIPRPPQWGQHRWAYGQCWLWSLMPEPPPRPTPGAISTLQLPRRSGTNFTFSAIEVISSWAKTQRRSWCPPVRSCKAGWEIKAWVSSCRSGSCLCSRERHRHRTFKSIVEGERREGEGGDLCQISLSLGQVWNDCLASTWHACFLSGSLARSVTQNWTLE